MGKVDIYIKPVEKVQMVQKKVVLLRDVAEVFTEGMSESEAETLSVFHIPSDRKQTYLLSVIDLIQVLKQKYPDAMISNVGETDILIEYLPKAEVRNRWLTGAKVAFVAAVLFIGSATTIMCFHTDVQMPMVFQNVYYMFYGENRDMPAILSVPYSIGLGVGIIMFFNHFSKFSLTEDPTPIEIEMTTYEKENNASVIDCLGRRKGGGAK